MSNSLAAYGPATALTITLTAVADGAARQALAVNNSVTKFLDALLEISVSLAAAASSANKNIDVYMAGSLDGAAWPDVISGADAAYTPGDLRNLMWIGTFYAYGGGTGPFKWVIPTSMGPVAALLSFPYWTVVLVNGTGQTINAGTIRFVGGQIAEG